MENKIYDITIVGAGPVGLFGAFYAGMRQMSINIIDSLDKVGGQLNALYPEKYIYDMPGFPKVMAKDLVRDMWTQAQAGHPDLFLNHKIVKIERKEHLEITCENDQKFLTRTVLLTLGMGAFSPRKLETEGIAEREGKNVHYVMPALDHFNDKEVLVVGGGDSAADWTMALAMPSAPGKKPRAKSVHLIHRTNRFSAHEATLDLLRGPDSIAKILTHHELKSLEDVQNGARKQIETTLIQNLTKETQKLTVDEIIICAGYLAKLDFVKESGLEMQGSCIKVNQKMATNIPGIFAAGDVCIYEGKLKLIATGVGEAAMAANFAKVYLDPDAKAFPGHSTSLMEKH